MCQQFDVVGPGDSLAVTVLKLQPQRSLDFSSCTIPHRVMESLVWSVEDNLLETGLSVCLLIAMSSYPVCWKHAW